MSADQRVLSLAAEISESGDRLIPDLLLQLHDIVESAPSGSNEAGWLKQSIYNYDLIPVLILVLKQDFSRTKGNWETSVKLSQFTCNVLMTLNPDDDGTFLQKSVPEAMINMMILARRIQERYIMSVEPDSYVTEVSSDKLIEFFQSILETLQRFIQGYPENATRCITSPWFLQLFITDDEETGIQMLRFLQFLVGLKNDIFVHVEDRLFFTILDEMTYTLSVTNSIPWASATIKCVLNICKAFPSAIDTISHRYKGLRLLISKWSGRSSLMRDLSQLIFLLEAGSAHRAEMERYHLAALKIQAVWRSHACRNRLRKQSASAAKIQKLFRNFKIRRENDQTKKRAYEALEHQIALSRKRIFREKLEEEIRLMETLPAPIVSQHVAREQCAAATKIQAHWKGRQQRKLLTGRLDDLNRFKAAVVIQRGVRKWLSRIQAKRKEPPAFQRPPGLTDERRVEIQQMIQDWRDHHPPQERTREEQEELHAHAQTLIQRHLYMSKQLRRKEQERLATLARIDTDVEMLLNAPNLNEASNTAATEHFVCRSVPIANRAKQLHSERLRRLRQPWWKQLQYFDENEDETMYIVDKQDVIVVDGKVM